MRTNATRAALVAAVAAVAVASGSLTAAASSGFASPDDAMATRAEAAQHLAELATRALGASAGTPFSDAGPETPAARLRAIGVAHGNPDGSFGPGAPLLRGQLAALSWRVLVAAGESATDGLGEELAATAAPPFTDIAGHAHATAIASAASAGLVVGRGDGTFAPDAPATDQHVRVVVQRLEQRMLAEGLLPGSPVPGAIIAHFDTPEGSFSAVVEDPASVERIRSGELGTHVGIPNGRILPGDGGVNTGHDWHVVDVELADMAMEVCDGTAAYIDRVGLDAWYETQGDRYCPWGAVLTGWQPLEG